MKLFVQTLLIGIACCVAEAIVISEVLASNKDGIKDFEGGFEDWIEIHNPSDSSSMDIARFTITDKIGSTGWEIPVDTIIEPGGYIIIFCSGKDGVFHGELHTNFKLSKDGEYIGLLDVNGIMVHEYNEFPAQSDDISYGIDANGDIGFLDPATPGSANPQRIQPVLEDVRFSTERGFFSSAFELSITTDTPTAIIHYTLDGSEPTEHNGSVYHSPMSISTTTICRAVAFAEGFSQSKILTHSFIFLADVLRQPAAIDGFPNNAPRRFIHRSHNAIIPLDMEMDPVSVDTHADEMMEAMTDIPSISLVSDLRDMFGPNGWYISRTDAEFKVSLEALYNDGTKHEQVDAGVENHSHNLLKRSMRINFRSEYGDREWKTDLLRKGPIPSDTTISRKLRRLIFRGGHNRCWTRAYQPDETTFTRDEFDRQTQIAMLGYGSHGTFVHLYLNGAYWGVYNVAERPDDEFAAAYFGNGKDDADWWFTNHGGASPRPNPRWSYLLDTLVKRDMRNATNWQDMASYVDIEAFTDYILCSFWQGKRDWPDNNWYVVGRQDSSEDGPTPFRFISWDGEETFRTQTRGASVHPQFLRTGQVNSNIPILQIWSALRENEEYASYLRYRANFHKERALSNENATERWDTINNFISKAILGESARWGDALYNTIDETGIRRTRENDWIPQVQVVREMISDNVQRWENAMERALFRSDQNVFNGFHCPETMSCEHWTGLPAYQVRFLFLGQCADFCSALSFFIPGLIECGFC